MHKTRAELIDLIADLKTKKDFEKEIKKRYKIYDELIDQDTIALLIVDELGRNKQSVTKIVDLTPTGDYTVIGKVKSISDSKTFKRKNGSHGKVINLEIYDDTGTCRLVLWNGDIQHIKNKEIQPGTIVKIINGYTKLGYSGEIEINLGRWGFLEVKQTGMSSKKNQPDNNTVEITGVLVQKEATKAFFKDDGEFGFVTSITLKHHNTKKEITLWDRCVKDIQAYKIGETITIKNITKKCSNGETELHVCENSSIQKRK